MDYVDQGQGQFSLAGAIALAPLVGSEFIPEVYLAILGPEAEGLVKVAADFAERVKQVPGTVGLELSLRLGLPAYAVRLKPGAVRGLGLTAPQLAASLRAYVNGKTATFWTTPDGDPAGVVLRLNQAQRQRIDQLRNLPVAFSKDGTPITLDSVATLEPVSNRFRTAR